MNTSDEARDKLVHMRLAQAHEMLRTAEKLLEFGDFRSVLNRTYYALFYALTALALKADFHTSKHGQLQGWFNKNFVKPGIFSPQLSTILRDVYDRRMDADYEIDPLPDSADIEAMLTDARHFVAQVEEYLRT